MNRQDINIVPKLDYLMLLPLMGLAFYVAFIPHLNYPYPVHIDEWLHLACSNEIIKEASVVDLTSPFSGGAFPQHQLYEIGFHLFWVVFRQTSGLIWLDIFRYFPSIVFMLTVLSTYVLAQSQGFGLEAALFTCLITTTVGILGPAFMVPMALGLLFIPLSLFIAFSYRTVWSYVVLFIFESLLVLLHGPTAAVLVIILIPFILINLKGEFKHVWGTTLALVTPFLISLPWTWSMLQPSITSFFTIHPLKSYVDYPPIIEVYGYLPILFSLLGTFLLSIWGGKKNYSLILGLLALLLMHALFFTFHYGVPLLYERGLTAMMLMLSIIAGAGLMGIRKFGLWAKLDAQLRIPLITQNMGNILCLILIGVTLAICIPTRQDIYYYHMIDDEDYQAFVWVKNNIANRYEKAILDPWKATAFTAITGKNIYSRIHSYPKPSDREVQEFLGKGCVDTHFLRENGISLVYTRDKCDNPDLVEVRKNVYLVKEPKETE